jgi:hypothetical protein
MAVVYKTESVGSSSGATRSRVVIANSGQLHMRWRPTQQQPQPPGSDTSHEVDYD